MGTIEQSLADMVTLIASLRVEVRELRDELRGKQRQDERWTVKDGMRYSHKGRTWWNERLTAGEVPNAVKVGHSWLLDPEATMRWLGRI